MLFLITCASTEWHHVASRYPPAMTMLLDTSFVFIAPSFCCGFLLFPTPDEKSDDQRIAPSSAPVTFAFAPIPIKVIRPALSIELFSASTPNSRGNHADSKGITNPLSWPARLRAPNRKNRLDKNCRGAPAGSMALFTRSTIRKVMRIFVCHGGSQRPTRVGPDAGTRLRRFPPEGSRIHQAAAAPELRPGCSARWRSACRRVRRKILSQHNLDHRPDKPGARTVDSGEALS